MALTNDAVRDVRGDGEFEEVSIATGSQLYINGLVTRKNTTARAVDATAATGHRILGLARSFSGPTGDGLGVTDGTEKVLVEYLSEAELSIATAIRTNTSLGLNVFVSDNETVGGTGVGTAGTRIAVGELISFTSTDKSTGYVALRRFAGTDIAV